MLTHIRSFLYISALFILIALSVGCSDPTYVGNDLVVNGATLNTDTAILPVNIYPVREDSLVSSSVAGISAVSLGIVKSPYFGKNKSSLYTQLRLGGSGVKFGAEAPVWRSPRSDAALVTGGVMMAWKEEKGWGKWEKRVWLVTLFPKGNPCARLRARYQVSSARESALSKCP